VDDHALQLLEFDRVAGSISELAVSPAGRRRLAGWRPIPEPRARGAENARLAEAIHRTGEPEAWVHLGRGDLEELIELTHDPGEVLDGPALREVAGWLEAARRTREAWTGSARERHPALAARVDELPRLDALEQSLVDTLDEDGAVRDDASPVLRRARATLREGERNLERRLERWAKQFGEGTYVTRHADRFVALVPAAGFPRRLGIVHDVSASEHSLFVEPLEMCEANNELLEQRAVAFEEERRILRALEASVRAAADELGRVADVLAHLDTLSARARWALARGATALNPEGDSLRLRQGRHPLLVDALGAERVVPLDLALEGDARVLLVSGPNMGGKTVVLKLTGLACALAHAALPVPVAEGSRIPELERVHVDLGDEQSISQGLSTFAAHLKTLGAMARDAGPRTLVLCDELGAGTDPDEGAALGQALIEHFVEHGAWGVLTTHLGSLKRAVGSMRGVTNAAMEFDAEGMGPRFRLRTGIPGASRALAMAERLGFDPQLVERARAYTPETTRAVESLLLTLERMRDSLDHERSELEAARERTEAAERGLRGAEAAAREALRDLRARLTRESEVLVARARELWQSVHREARRAEKRRDTTGALREEISAVEGQLDALGAAADRASAEFGGGAVEPAPVDWVRGGRVRVSDLGVDAEIVEGPDAEGKVKLRRGGWTIQSHVSRLAPVPAHDAGRGEHRSAREPQGSAGARAGSGASWNVPDEAPPLEVDVRGMDVDEALRTLDQGLDRGLITGLSEVRIIHGHGRGVLRNAVDRHLRGHPQVASCRMGEMREGGRGVTVAKLR
jgi:DNA mismatch repair protein MutS2